ncbi:hypothetical protein [Teredinibacter franksiae]|uniref:hypothetical protein n=1 Tax=Teredinibacter franksiae TaxID=2761453 RepID=UPI001626E7CD|nr:hypothetical protein [Teredinibacter franksiae]
MNKYKTRKGSLMILSYRVVCKRIAAKCLLGVAVIGLAACGGGGGGGTNTTPTTEPVPDTQPNAFSFSTQGDVALGAVVESEAVTISGMNAAASVVVSGGEYAIGNGAYSSAAGSISNGQAVKVRATAAAEFATGQTVSLTIGGVTGEFTVTTAAQDITPNAIDLGTVTDVTPGATASSVSVGIEGITGAVPISISNGTYTLGSGSPTSEAGTIENGQTVTVTGTAAATFATEIVVALTIGDTTENFSVTTVAEDTNPDAFELGATATVSAPGATAESQLITVAGINSTASISITNGEYRIDGVQDYSSAASTVTNGQQIQVRATAGTIHNDTTTATLTIGNQSDTFAVIAEDQTPPTAEVIFPTANTMSNGTFVTLRGNASDDFGPVTEINVTVTTDDGTVEVDTQTLTATGDEDFQDTWSVQVGLASEKLNTLQVTATDFAGEASTPVTLTVLQRADALTTDFPEGNDVSIGRYEYAGIEWDRENDRLFLACAAPVQILAIDIETGTRSIFIDKDPAFQSFSMLKLLPEQNTLLFAEQNYAIIFNANLETGAFAVLTDDSSPDSNVDIGGPYSMELGSDGALYVADAAARFYSVNMDSGARSLISDASRPSGGANPFTNPMGLVLDEANDRALLTDYTTQQLLWVDLTTGARTVWVDSDQLNAPFDIKMDTNDNRIILTDEELEAVIAVDLSTGVLTTLSGTSKPASDVNSLQIPWGIVIDEQEDIAFVGSQSKVVSSGYASILLVDLTTGERIVVTNSIAQ